MYKKLTIEFIRLKFEKENYTLLTTEYKNSSQKLEYLCPHGHKHRIRWDDWKQGHRCFYCHGNIKKTIEFIELEFKKENYKLLTKKYINSNQKLKCICPNNHLYEVTWRDWNSGRRCFKCSIVIRSFKKRLNFDIIKKSFDDENYKLLSKTYKNAHQKLEYVCFYGHKGSIKWNHWNSGHRCPICASICHSIKFSGKNHPMWKGGISCEPYCFEWSSKEFKNYIKERDGNRCLNPDCWGTSKRLSIHHIDYNKKNCGPQNLITLCTSCNSRANKDRDWHTSWYQAILNKRYGI